MESIAYVTPNENAIKIATITGHAERHLTLTSWGGVNPDGPLTVQRLLTIGKGVATCGSLM